MSSGLVHNKVTFVASWPVSVVVAILTLNFWYAVVAMLGCLSGIMFTPDLDLTITTRSEWLLIRRSKLIGYVWIIIWYPYAKFIPHRSWASHYPIISTFIRVVYFSVFLFVVVGLIRLMFPSVSWYLWFVWDNVSYKVYLSYLFGLVVSDTLHWFYDYFPKWHKKRNVDTDMILIKKHDGNGYYRV